MTNDEVFFKWHAEWDAAQERLHMALLEAGYHHVDLVYETGLTCEHRCHYTVAWPDEYPDIPVDVARQAAVVAGWPEEMVSDFYDGIGEPQYLSSNVEKVR